MQSSKEFEKITRIRIDRTIAALTQNNMRGYFVSGTAELLSLIDELCAKDNVITAGGSKTLEETGVIAHLHKNYGEKFLDREECTNEEWNGVVRKGFSADTFFSSTNAVTESGELYNIDGIGSRVSAQIFGPAQVIMVVGANKIVPNIESAFERLSTVAAPCNAMRMGRSTPCTHSGQCERCSSDERICSAYVILCRQIIKDRIKVIILPDSYGY